MAINLSRNTKVYFTTSVDSFGVISEAGVDATNTYQIQVLDGYSFSQGTNQTTITINEAGNTPSRGQRAFNTALNPVDFSFSTYIRPTNTSSFVTADEKYLWNALLGAADLDNTGTTATSVVRSTTASSTATIVLGSAISGLAAGDVLNIQGSTSKDWNVPTKVTAVNGTTVTVELFKAPSTTSGTTAAGTIKVYKGQWAKGAQGTASTNMSYASTMGANKNQLQKFGMIFAVDNVVYLINNCALDQATISFGLDAISMVAWTGKGTTLKEASTLTPSTITATTASTTASYITNKLSTVTLESNIAGADITSPTSVAYKIPVTGGQLTINNNLTYLTPTNLGVVNSPITYYTGVRAISGNITAYLRTGGTDDTGALLQTILNNAATSTELKYRLQIEMGGASNANRLEFEMPGTSLQVPQVNVADIVATTINFTAQAYDPNTVGATMPAYDATKSNELLVRYYAA